MFARIFFEKEKKKLSDQKSGSFLCIWIFIIHIQAQKEKSIWKNYFLNLEKYHQMIKNLSCNLLQKKVTIGGNGWQKSSIHYEKKEGIPHEPTRNIHIHPKAIPHPPERTTFMEVQAEPDMIGNYSEMQHLSQ